jgi:hypothetical protein
VRSAPSKDSGHYLAAGSGVFSNARAPAGEIEPGSSRAAHWWCHGFCAQNNARITESGGPRVGYSCAERTPVTLIQPRVEGSGPLHRQRVVRDTSTSNLDRNYCLLVIISGYPYSTRLDLDLPPSSMLLTRYVAGATAAGARWALPVSNDPCSIAASIILFPLIIEVVQITMFLRPKDVG